MMNRASGVRANLMDCADIATFSDDGVRGELAHLELGPLRVVLRFRLVVPNGGVLVPWQYSAAIFLCPVGGADLYQFGLCRHSRCDMGLYLGLITGRVGTAVALLTEVIPKEQLVVSRSLRAFSATARR